MAEAERHIPIDVAKQNAMKAIKKNKEEFRAERRADIEDLDPQQRFAKEQWKDIEALEPKFRADRDAEDKIAHELTQRPEALLEKYPAEELIKEGLLEAPAAVAVTTDKAGNVVATPAAPVKPAKSGDK